MLTRATQHWWFPFLLLPLFLALYAINFRTLLLGDAQAQYFSAASLTWSGDFDVSEYEERLRADHGGKLPYFVLKHDNHIYQIFNPAPAAFLAPFYLVASAIGGDDFRESLHAWGLLGKVVNTLFGFMGGLFLWLVLYKRFPAAIAVFMLAALWFGTPLWAASVDYLQHGPECLFRLVAVYLIFRSTREERPFYFLGGLALALSVISRYQGAVAALPLALAFVFQHRRDWRVALFILGGVMLAPAILLYHWKVFGSPIRSGPNYFLEWNWPIHHGLFALLFNLNKGLLIHSPWALAMGPALVAMLANLRRRVTTEPLLIGATAGVVLTLLMYSRLNVWFGGWTWGYRYLLDALPEICVLSAFGMSVVWRWVGARCVLWAALVLSIAIQSIGALTYDSEWHSRHDGGPAPPQEWVWQVSHCQILYGLQRRFISIGESKIAYGVNPFERHGFSDLDLVDGRQARWIQKEGSAYFFAKKPNPVIRVWSPVMQQISLSVDGEGQPPQVVSANRWVEFPVAIPFQHGCVIGITAGKVSVDPKSGRRFGVAISEN